MAVPDLPCLEQTATRRQPRNLEVVKKAFGADGGGEGGVGGRDGFAIFRKIFDTASCCHPSIAHSLYGLCMETSKIQSPQRGDETSTSWHRGGRGFIFPSEISSGAGNARA